MKTEYDKNGNLIYQEWKYGKWVKYEYDQNNNQIYEEWWNGYIEYPKGIEYYYQCIRKQKIKRILNEKKI